MDLPRNVNGDPEFASVTFKFDAIFNTTGDIPARYSKDIPEVALAKVFAYYDEERLGQRADILDLIHRGANAEAVYIYAPATKDQTINVVLGTGTMRTLIDHPKFGGGSFLVMIENLAATIAASMAQAQQARGGTPPLLVIEAETAPMVAAEARLNETA